MAVVVDAVREVTGGAGLPDEITQTSLLEADLQLESIELAALALRLRERFGDRADLLAYLASLDIDALIDLTVGDVARYVGSLA